MALRKTFEQIVEATRNEARLSSNTSRGVDHLEHIEQIIKRNYYSLCEDFDWKHLQIKRGDATGNRKVLQAGERYYDWPVNLNPLKVSAAWVKWGGTWQPVNPGIGYENYSAYDPAEDQRVDPVSRWDYYGGTQFEVWPLPATNGTADGDSEIAFEGQKLPEQVVDNTSRLDMDDILLSLMAAAELLQENDSKAAQGKAGLASARFLSMRSNMGGVVRYVMGGGAIGQGASEPRHPTFIRVSS